ncbi:hypothetical protein MMPV_006380 [Pyropia vietnamensis]
MAGVASPAATTAATTAVTTTAATTAATAIPQAADLYTAVADDLDALHHAHGVRVESLDADVCQLGVAITDPSGRVHHLALTIPPTYPTGPGAVTVRADVPTAFAPSPITLPLPAPRRGGALAAAITAAAAAVSTPHAQLFWSVMDDLDAACHVLEPPLDAARRRSVPYRRLALDAVTAASAAAAAATDVAADVVNDADADADVAPTGTIAPRHLSVRVWVAPFDAGGLPTLALLGAAPVVRRLRGAVEARAGSWSGARGGSIRAALGEVLGLGGAAALLPPPPGPTTGGMTCGLCDTAGGASNDNGNDDGTAAADDGGGPPFDSSGGLCGYVVCDAPSCARLYHRRCVVERFRSEGENAARAIRSTIRGACPHCRQEMRVTVPPGE